MSKHVLVVGSINVDYVIQTDRVPVMGESLPGSGFMINFGGKGANQASAIAKQGCSVKMLGAVGCDDMAQRCIQNLQGFGIDTSAIAAVSAPTGAAVITVCKGDNYIIVDEGANRFVTPDVIRQNEALFDWADILVMQYEIPVEAVIEAARLAKEHGVYVILNPAPAKQVDERLYPLIDRIIPNEFEAEQITGILPSDEATAAKAIRALQKIGCKDATITLGKRGCVYSVGEEIHSFGIYPVTAVDSTAAGDSFIGGLCSKLCEGASTDRAVAFASAVSAITVSRHGAAVSIPTADEVEEFLSTHAPTKGVTVL